MLVTYNLTMYSDSNKISRLWCNLTFEVLVLKVWLDIYTRLNINSIKIMFAKDDKQFLLGRWDCKPLKHKFLTEIMS